ncbi:MAG: hypothetical protein ACRDND_24410, partial [Streptosporangiaceae bacterium]
APSGGAWEQATGLAGAGLDDTGLDEDNDDPLAAPEPLGHHEAAGPPAPDSAGLPGRADQEG